MDRGMRTKIEIDDRLMKESLRVAGLATKSEVVELGLRILVRLSKQEQIRRARGRLQWLGDLEGMRSGKCFWSI
jgi:Arc/MetJ family transcription regulator